jgi:preprotein translocase subunit SecG
MQRITRLEVVLWALLLIGQVLVCAALGLGVYLTTQKSSTLTGPAATLSVEHLAKLKGPEKPLDSTQVGNLVDYCIGLEKIINAHQRAAAEISTRSTELTLFFIAVLVLSVLLEIAILARGRRSAAP